MDCEWTRTLREAHHSALQLAWRRGSETLEVADLVEAILKHIDSDAQRLLQATSLDEDGIRALFEKPSSVTKTRNGKAHLPFSPGVMSLFERACGEMRLLNGPMLSSAHVLIAWSMTLGAGKAQTSRTEAWRTAARHLEGGVEEQ